MYVAPKPYGGKLALKDLWAQELNYPQNALQNRIQGSVELVFTVNSEGVMKNLQVFIPLEPACDAEAKRLTRLIRWHPAESGGEPVTTEHILKVDFNIKRYQKYLKKRSERKALNDLPPPAPGARLYKVTELDTLPTPLIEDEMNGLSRYFSRNMNYPVEAFKRNVQGTVIMEFVVEPSGSITNIEAVKPLGGGCSEEAYRLVRGMSWRPAIKNGARVRTLMRVEIEFRLVAPE